MGVSPRVLGKLSFPILQLYAFSERKKCNVCGLCMCYVKIYFSFSSVTRRIGKSQYGLGTFEKSKYPMRNAESNRNVPLRASEVSYKPKLDVSYAPGEALPN